MYRSLYLAVIFLLSSCGSESSNEIETRDLSEAISFSELVELRMEPDDSIDGKIILITSEVNAYFNPGECARIDLMLAPECTEDMYSAEVSEPTYQGIGSLGPCSEGFALTSSDVSEKLYFDKDEYNKFSSLKEEYNVPVNFYAKVEFVERPVWCSAQVNFGIKLTLKEGEESHLLEQFN